MRCSVFFQVPVGAEQSAPGRLADTLAQIERADALGFHGAWLAESHFAPAFSVLSAPLVVLAAAAARTARIRLGTAVLQLPLHDPVRVAEAVATLDVVSGGRMDCGVGRGSSAEQFRAFGVPWAERETRFEEAVAVIRRAWTAPRLCHAGAHFRYDGVDVAPRPVQRPHPPLWLAANGARTAALAGELGVGLLLSALAYPLPTALAAQVHRYREAFRPDPETQKSAARPRVAAVLWTFPAASLDDARARVEPSLRRHPAGRHVTFADAAARMALFGASADVAARVRALADAGEVDELVCWFNPGGLVPHRDVLAAMERFAGDVVGAAADTAPVPAGAA